jgi:hypothetical protein
MEIHQIFQMLFYSLKNWYNSLGLMLLSTIILATEFLRQKQLKDRFVKTCNWF